MEPALTGFGAAALEIVRTGAEVTAVVSSVPVTAPVSVLVML